MSPRSIAGRVALATGSSVAVGGLLVALVAAGLADTFAREREDEQLRGAARTTALELSEGADPAWVASDETRELAHTGMRVAIYQGERFLGGDDGIGRVPAGTCADSGARRACAVRSGAYVAVVARARDVLDPQRETFGLAAGIAVVLVGILGGLAARWIARVSVAPLARLEARVEGMGEGDAAADLGPDEGVAEVDALRATLASVLARLTAALSQSQRFASDAAHELRTPLTAILGELELAAEDASSDEERDSIERARRTATRLGALVERLLVLARPQARLDHPEPVDLVDVAEDAREAMPVASRERVSIAGADAAPVEGDHALLVTMTANAIENALKHSDGPVTVTVAAGDREASIAVEDEGHGVPPEERERVFAAFYRTRESRASGVPGHGIGLALVAHVAALHGGDAKLGDGARGARLEMRLPRRPRALDAGRPAERPGSMRARN